MTELEQNHSSAAPARQSKTPGLRCIDRWKAAARFRREMDYRLLRLDLTFTRWLVLHSLHALIEETGDAVHQTAVARRADIDGVTTRYVMLRLEKDGLVSRGPDCAPPALRIILTDLGRWKAQEGHKELEACAVRWPEGDAPSGGLTVA